MLASLAKPVTMISNVSHPPTACVDLFVVRSVEDSCFVICMGGASRDPIRECSDRGLIAVLYCGSHRVRMLTQLSSRNFLSTLRRATSSPTFTLCNGRVAGVTDVGYTQPQTYGRARPSPALHPSLRPQHEQSRSKKCKARACSCRHPCRHEQTR